MSLKVDEYKKSIEGLSETLKDSLKKSEANHKEVLDTVKTETDALRERFDRLQLRNDGQDRRMEGIESTMEGVSHRVEELE